MEKFVNEGAQVLAVDLDQGQAEQLASDYNGKVAGMGMIVTEYEQVEQMLETAIEHFGTLDIVVNNAGIGSAKMLLDHVVLLRFSGHLKMSGGLYPVH